MSHLRLLGVGFVACLCQASVAQYSQDFDSLMGGATGSVLTGQDGFYLPAGVTNVDQMVFTYAGNPLGVPSNPNGGSQFGVGVGPAIAGTFARAQRDYAFSAGQWKISFDLLANRDNVAPFTNNVGSFSMQPQTNAHFIQLFSYEDVLTGANWQALFLAFDAAGVQAPQPGFEPDPAFSNLNFGDWYHFETTVDITANQITEVSIQNITAGSPKVTANPVGYYLGGGATPLPVATGFRMFAGNGTTGNNTIAWDNFKIEDAAGGCYADCDGSGGLDFFDFLCFQNEFTAGTAYADCDGSGGLDFFDFLCFQNEFTAGCP